MSNIVFILGAGASKQCGAPLMEDFLDKAHDLYQLNLVSDKKVDFENVYKAIAALQAVHSKSQLDLKNIESIFTAFEVAKILNKLPGYKNSEISKLIESLKELIVTTLEKTIDFPINNENYDSPEPYGKFCSLLRYLNDRARPKRDFSIITFNYDIAIDFSLYNENFDYYYNLDDETVKRGFPLLKLHGSLNWATCVKCKKIVPWMLDDYFRQYKIRNINKIKKRNIRIGTQLKDNFEHCSTKVNHSPVLVPPTWNKSEQYQTLSKVWSKAAYELETAEYIFIIGYSLPDTDVFFRLLFGLGTIGNILLRKIIVFNPERSGLVKNRFESMLGPGALARFNYENITFDESIDFIKELFQNNNI